MISMKKILILLSLVLMIVACSKNEANEPSIIVEGYWSVQDPIYTVANPTADLFHLFKGQNAFYRFSFLKTHNYSLLTSTPRADSMISYYQVVGKQLMLPNPAPSTTNVLPGCVLMEQTGDQMTFSRLVITKRNGTTGKIEATRTDTIRYTKLSNPTQIAYFNNYLKKWHP
jgi:hypothetical protein